MTTDRGTTPIRGPPQGEASAAGWESRYRVVDEEREHLHYAGEDYETCVLTDLSMEGAGLHFDDGDVTVGDRIELDLPLGAEPPRQHPGTR